MSMLKQHKYLKHRKARRRKNDRMKKAEKGAIYRD